MFSLQHMIDDMATRLGRLASQKKRRMTKSLKYVHGLSYGKLAEIFSHAGLVMPEDLPAYIEVGSLNYVGLNAFIVNQTIEVKQFPRYIAAIREGRERVAGRHYRQGDLHTLIAHDYRLSGINMYLVTNDTALVRKLAAAGFNPPGPWIVFYGLGPFTTYTQGSPEYWNCYIWSKYWEALTFAEQDVFLERKRQETVGYIPDDEWQDWVEGIRFRDPRTHEHIESDIDQNG